jgi:hypothetical protein
VKCKPWDQKLTSERLYGSPKNCLTAAGKLCGKI